MYSNWPTLTPLFPLVENDADADHESSLSRNCPYLDTVKRSMLDFDFEKLCSVSLSNHNVYACLVCGKYFQGRGKSSYAYLHSIHERHHVFINLKTLKVYCLPDGYEVIDSSLNDITFVLKPQFQKDEVSRFDVEAKTSHDLLRKPYQPGFIGLNNIKANDYVNVVLQALVHIPLIRDFFINEKNYKDHKTPLVETFGELVRKMWNSRAFKAQVSPHELIQAVSTASQGTFKPGYQSDAADFLSWFLNALHRELGGTKKPNSSVIYRAFQGRVEVTTRPLISDSSEEGEKGLKSEEEREAEERDQQERTVTEEVSSLFLTLELPPPPLFKNELDRNIIPQIPLQDLLNKFSGMRWVVRMSFFFLLSNQNQNFFSFFSFLLLVLVGCQEECPAALPSPVPSTILDHSHQEILQEQLGL